jgi:hypothetical protein
MPHAAQALIAHVPARQPPHPARQLADHERRAQKTVIMPCFLYISPYGRINDLRADLDQIFLTF